MTQTNDRSTKPAFVLRGCQVCRGDLIYEFDPARGRVGARYRCLLCGREYLRTKKKRRGNDFPGLDETTDGPYPSAE
jgi:hypothetical protein